jgi:hypothetical protein
MRYVELAKRHPFIRAVSNRVPIKIKQLVYRLLLAAVSFLRRVRRIPVPSWQDVVIVPPLFVAVVVWLLWHAMVRKVRKQLRKAALISTPDAGRAVERLEARPRSRVSHDDGWGRVQATSAGSW